MTAYAKTTAQALYRYPFGELHQKATQANNGGDVIQIADGRCGVVQTLGGGADNIAINDPEDIRTNGVFDMLSASATVLAQGVKAYWDPVALAIVGSGGGTNAAFYAGLTTAAKVSGVTTARVDLNAVSPSLTGPQVATVAAAGTNQATAAALGGGFALVTGGNNSAGVILTAGESVKVKNGANSPLFVYPPVGGSINAIAVNTALNIAVSQVAVEFVAFNATQFYTVPLVPS